MVPMISHVTSVVSRFILVIFKHFSDNDPGLCDVAKNQKIKMKSSLDLSSKSDARYYLFEQLDQRDHVQDKRKTVTYDEIPCFRKIFLLGCACTVLSLSFPTASSYKKYRRTYTQIKTIHQP